MRCGGGCLAALAIAAGCGGGSEPAIDAPPGSYASVSVDLALVPERELDVLLLIDNSISMGEEHEKLIAQMSGFLSALTIDGALPDLHLGIATSDIGTMGVELGDAACTNPGEAGILQTRDCPVTDSYVIDVDDGAGGRTRNYTAPLPQLLDCLIYMGDSGCGIEQHLEATRMALDPAVNPGFLRQTAQLALIVLADEDDCSASSPTFFGPESPELGPITSFRCFEFGVTCDQPDPRSVGIHTGCHAREDSPYMHGVRRYVDLLEGIRPGRVTVGVIAGVNEPVDVGRRTPTGGGAERPALNPSCTWTTPAGAFQAADPAVRLFEFARAFGDRGASFSLCDDLAGPVSTLGTMIHDRMVGQPCLRAVPRDLDPTLEGLQPSCEVTRVGIDQPATPFPACDATASNPPCWRLVEDAAQCGAATPHRLDAVGLTPTYGEHIQARCEVVD